MGSLLEFRRPTRVPPTAVFGLATRLVERDNHEGRRAVLEIDGLATFCVVAEIPTVGDVIHGPLTAIVEKVRVTRDGGHVRISARCVAPEMDSRQPNELEPGHAESPSPRVDVVLREMRRLCSVGVDPTDELPHGA
ncbi:MAG: hypothetical protein LH654_00075 [Thermoleophilia bacterium]|nr:hypothetical protein [Thermoleophilia bacterium]